MLDVHELIECTSDAAFAVKEDRRVLAWNKAARELLGYSAREAVGRKCHEVIGAVFANGEPLCTPSCAGGRCFERGQPFSVKSCLALHRDGRRVALELLSNMVVRCNRTDWSTRLMRRVNCLMLFGRTLISRPRRLTSLRSST